MKIKVPFYKSKKDTDCGPLALKMALAYLGEEYKFEKLSKLERSLDSGMVWSLGIAVASSELGYKTRFISNSNFSESDNLNFYKKYANDKARIVLEELKQRAKKIGLQITEEDMKLEELLKNVSKDSIPIVLVNWFVIAGKEGFNGHFLPITGYDKDNVYVHNPGIQMAQAYLPIKRELFIKAWESKGTDKDTILIARK